MKKIIELERGNCKGSDGVLRLWKLNKGDKFVVLHGETESESPWYFIKSDGMYAVVAKRPDAGIEEYKYIMANAPVRIVE